MALTKSIKRSEREKWVLRLEFQVDICFVREQKELKEPWIHKFVDYAFPGLQSVMRFQISVVYIAEIAD